MTRRAHASPQRATGPFALHAAAYRRQGYAPIPVKPGAKQPLIADWPRWCDELPSPELVATWARRYPDAGIAIACGPASGITALDLDDDIDGLHARICEALGPSPVAKRGVRAPTRFYRYSGERSRALRKNGQTVAEILAGKRLVIIPPTIHPDTGQPYQWLTPETLLDCSPASLPTLDAARLTALFDHPKLERPLPKSRAPRTRSRDAELMAEALIHIPADIDRHSWIRIGMALKAALGDALGFELWDAWSSTGTKYDAGQMPAQWRSFPPDGRITAGTLFYFAKQHGWQPPRAAQRQRHAARLGRQMIKYNL
jgi:hypothetical protein